MAEDVGIFSRRARSGYDDEHYYIKNIDDSCADAGCARGFAAVSGGCGHIFLPRFS
ncbi:hypothetical protein ETAE_0949 [Edwardsiella piscicida]|uniref:Uncharacterized protein n=1 Tax=Edwardsiella piscicida TaxID=1263550 RepID=A0AAU8P410_EDWPI|nr:hypothetical protein ETAE_0949 [Edwardsiella tarda EIB202]